MIDFCGKPMIAWTIEAALSSGIFHRVLVSTDDTEIAEVAKAFGAQVPFLRKHASDDISPISTATLHALEQAEIFWNERYAVVTQLMANCPLRDASVIRNAWSYFVAGNIPYLLSCFEYGFMNPWLAHTMNDSGNATPLFPSALRSRSQDLPRLYCPTGAVWIARVPELRKAGTFYGPGYSFFPISWRPALDIDSEDDLALARLVRYAGGTDRP